MRLAWDLILVQTFKLEAKLLGDWSSWQHASAELNSQRAVSEEIVWVSPRAYILLWRRGHATPHMPVETAKCWLLLKIEPSLSLKPAQTPLKNGPKPLAKLYNSPKNSRAPTAWRSTQTAQLPLPPAHAFGSIFSNHQHFAVSTGICGVACPLLRRSI